MAELRPSMWQQRRMRIERQTAERLERKQARQQRRDDEDEEEEDDTAARPRRPIRRSASRAGERTNSRSSKASAIVSRNQLKQQRGGIERMSAWIVLAISFVGSIAAFHGGFGPLIATIQSGQLNMGALLGGILIQLVLTFLEWYYFDNWRIAWSARIVDAFTTALGYGPLFFVPLVTLLYNRGIERPEVAAWGIIGIASLGIAWFPENRLVD